MRKNYSRYFLTVTVFQVLLCLAMPAYAGQTDLKGGTAAVVNGKTITMEDLDREINHVREKIASTGRTLDPSQMPLLKKTGPGRYHRLGTALPGNFGYGYQGR